MDDLSLEFRQCVVGRETLFFCTKIYKRFDPFFNFFFDRYKQLVRCAVQTSVHQIAFSFDDNFYNREIDIIV